MPPISQTGTVEPLTVTTPSEPVVDPALAATPILTGMDATLAEAALADS